MTPRILHLLPGAHLGGAEWMTLHLARAHLDRGCDVRLLLFETGAVAPAAAELAIPVTVASIPVAARASKSRYRNAMAAALRSTVTDWRPDLVHSHVPITNLIANRTLPALHVPWVATIHGSWRQFAYAPQTVARPWLKSYFLLRQVVGTRVVTRSAARLVAVAESSRNDLLMIGVPASRVATIHNGLPLLRSQLPQHVSRARLGMAADDFLIGSLGYFAPVKGFDILIRAFARLAPHYPLLRLLIAGGDVLGDTTVRRSLERLIAQLGVADRAGLIGPLNPWDGFLSALDVFVVSSRTEGFSLALVEAMQHGKPSVVTSAGGSVEAARPGLESLLFQSADPASLAQALERLILDAGLRHQLGQAAAARASTYLTLSRCAEDYDRLYHAVLAERHGSM